MDGLLWQHVDLFQYQRAVTPEIIDYVTKKYVAKGQSTTKWFDSIAR